MGLTRDVVLTTLRLSRHQYYYKPTGKRPGKKPTQVTKRIVKGVLSEETNDQVVQQITDIKSDPDTDYGYRKMYYALMILGYYINHKKIYRLMKEKQLLKDRHKKQTKNYVQYRNVVPEGPLQVLEMDIKYVWIVKERRHAFILSIIDTFTRFILHWQLGYTMKSTQVKHAWEQVIINHLQPADMLKNKMHIEVRNDNGPQFGSKMIQTFFKDNYLNQVFTHPYTPQENGHIESFHNILSNSLAGQTFWDLDQLTERLTTFYEKYNNVRLHGSIASLTPRLFWEVWDKNMVTRTMIRHNKAKFTLNIAYQQLSGNENLREVPCLNPAALDAQLDLQKEAIGPEILHQPSVQRSPSVVPC